MFTLHCQVPVAQGLLELLHAGEAVVKGSWETVGAPVPVATRPTAAVVVKASELLLGLALGAFV